MSPLVGGAISDTAACARWTGCDSRSCGARSIRVFENGQSSIRTGIAIDNLVVLVVILDASVDGVVGECGFYLSRTASITRSVII